MHLEFPELTGTANEIQTLWIIIRILLERWAKTIPAGVNEKPAQTVWLTNTEERLVFSSSILSPGCSLLLRTIIWFQETTAQD